MKATFMDRVLGAVVVTALMAFSLSVLLTPVLLAVVTLKLVGWL